MILTNQFLLFTNASKVHCREDLEKIDKAAYTLHKVYDNSKLHSQQLNNLQIKELEKNKSV